MSDAAGKVYLVGAGPGDPDLLTVRARDVLAHCDVVVYDALANDLLLHHAARAERIFVGKAADRHTLLQDEINGLLIREARAGRRIVRLKGGDPFVFGRGGEEALALAQAGVPFEVVPGITSALAAPAYAGIPLTHRGLAQSYTVVTGHTAPGQPGAPDFAALGAQGTLVVLMGVGNLPAIAEAVLAGGRNPETPAAVIEWGTYPRQRTIVADLKTIADKAAEAAVRAPAVVVIGEVAALHRDIAWFESRPLFGCRIVVTRSQEQAGVFAHHLHELGADVFEFPTIAIAPPESPADFGYIGAYDWVVLTSVNGVAMLFERLDALGCDARDLAGVKLCVIGSATAAAVRERFLRIDLMPERYVAEDVLDALAAAGDLEGKRFLLPRADIARSFLPEELRARGAEVTELVAYRTVRPEACDELADAMLAYQPDLVTFTSSSTARNFAELLGPERLARVADTAAFGAIGPITADTAEGLGMAIAVEPVQHDIPHFVDAIVQWRRANRP